MTEPAPSTMVDLPVRSAVASELVEALEAYAESSAAVKVALLSFEADNGALYAATRETKHARYNAAKEVFERVLAHIGVHAR